MSALSSQDVQREEGTAPAGESLPLDDYLNPIDERALHAEFHAAEPFPHIVIPELLRPGFLREVCAAYPSYEEAKRLGTNEFRRVNENLKIQITDTGRFPAPVRTLHALLASEPFRDRLSRITGIPDLLADPSLQGGGMHVMGPGGRLDVHVDFNELKETGLYRRLNILVYLCEDWDPAWGGAVDLWDANVRRRAACVAPSAGRCLVFRTGEDSWHGVTPIACPPERTRNSFAAYYYTEERPNDAGLAHTTVFRPRPQERWRSRLLLPLERAKDRGSRLAARLRRSWKRG